MAFLAAGEPARLNRTLASRKGRQWTRRSRGPLYTTGTLPTADGWSTSPAGPCRSNTPRSSKSTGTIRSAVGIADISHMGRLRFEGPGAAVFLAELLTRRVADMELGQIRYSLVTNDAGRNPRRRAGGLLPQFARPAVLHAGGQRQQPREDRRLGPRPPAPGAGRAAGPGNHLDRRQPAVGDVRHPGAALGRTVAAAGGRRPAVDALLPRGAGRASSTRPPSGRAASSAAPATPARTASS